MDFEKVSQIYQEAYNQHGYSLNSIFIPKGRQKERFDVLTQQIKDVESFNVLDFGCGLGQLFTYMQHKFSDFSYVGVDIVPQFVAENTIRYEKANFLHIKDYKEIVTKYDYIISAGVFNLLYKDSKIEQFNIVQETLTHLFAQTNKVLSVDFMTDQVDFQQSTAYHQNPTQIYEFATQKLSKRVIIDQSYMPYEFTIHIFKDDTVLRPDNIYYPLS